MYAIKSHSKIKYSCHGSDVIAEFFLLEQKSRHYKLVRNLIQKSTNSRGYVKFQVILASHYHHATFQKKKKDIITMLQKILIHAHIATKNNNP